VIGAVSARGLVRLIEVAGARPEWQRLAGRRTGSRLARVALRPHWRAGAHGLRRSSPGPAAALGLADEPACRQQRRRAGLTGLRSTQW